MQKIILRLSVFLSALVIGIGFLYVGNVFDRFSGEEVSVVVDNPVLTDVFPDAVVTDSNRISSCLDEIKYRPDSKSQTIKRGVLNGFVICGELPEYPSGALEKDISGIVLLDISADDTGRITKAAAGDGNPLLNAAAVKAAYQTRLCPTMLGGKFMKVNGFLTYKFDLETGVSLIK